MKNKKTIFLSILLLVFLYLSYMWQSDLLNTISLLSGVICVYLAGQGNIHTFTFGIVNSATYAYVSFISGLNGEALLNGLFYLPMQFIGLYLWRKHQNKDSNSVETATMNTNSKLIYLTLTIVGILLLGKFLSTIDGQLTPYLDATTTILSITAQFMMLQRFYQQWFVYIVINILSIFMWVNAGDNTMILMWSAYLANSILGLYTWKKELNKNA